MSSSLYDPDGDAVLDGLDYIKLLSQRDLSAAIPINFVTIPGVSLTAACFPFGRYDRAPAAKCFSNLLAVGFRRLDVDLYWDVSRTTWSFCPVELGDIQPRLSVSQDTSTSQRPSSTASLTAEGIPGAPAATQTPGEEDSNVQKLRPRQKVTAASASSDGSAVLSHSGQATLSAATLPSATTTETATLVESGSTVIVEGVDPEATGTASDQTLLSVGDYLCSPGLDLHLFLDVLYGHFANTEDNLNATMKYVVLNLHAAASASDPNGSGTTPSGSNLPQGNSLLSSLISANNSQYLFTPNLLLDQRADLNQANSWFTVSQSNAPDSQFYKVDRSNQLASTPDGWPSEGVVELMRARRMLAGFGTIDSQMAGYNFSGDASAIFPAGYLSDFRDLTFASNGSVSSGCIFRGDGGNDDDDPSVENSNSSWAVTDNFHSDTSILPSSISLDTYLSQARNTIDCGITPILNSTLLNASADANPLPYRSFALSSIWSWAEDEPRTANITDPNVDADMANRCAVLNATSSRWQARDCGESHHAACRLNEEPYDFRISDASAAYAKAGDACRGSLSFAAARTSLENAYLLAAWRAYRGGSADQDAPDVDDELLWVDFNDLDVARCWVVGQNSTCPYQVQPVGEGRTIVVPTVAAVIVFVLALLTVFVKCAANRRNTRRRRKRGDDGWDYEGVPS